MAADQKYVNIYHSPEVDESNRTIKCIRITKGSCQGEQRTPPSQTGRVKYLVEEGEEAAPSSGKLKSSAGVKITV